MKHLLSSFMLFLILFIGHSSYVKGDTTIASGTIDGTSIQWSVTSSDGTQENLKLSITGSGAIPSYLSSFSPWENYSQKTTEIYVAPTITEIGDYAFYQTAITSFEIPSSCTKIGSSAFIHCTKLKEIYIPSNVESIGAMAFKGCSSLSLIHYDGRCTSKTIISSNANDLGVANGKIIEKEGTGSSYAFIPDGWEYYTHGEKCKGGAWVAESGTGYERKLFFYAQKSGATVNYVVNGNAATTSPECHPWRVNCEKYISLEINKNISAISNTELTGYIDGSNAMTGYKNIQSITVESGNPSYVVGDEGALYDKAKTKILLYPAKSTATNVDVPATVSKIGSCAFFGAKNLKSINFLGTITSIENSAFAQASSLNYMYFVAETAPTSYSKSAFVNLPSTGVVLANAESDAWNKFTNTIGSGWTFNVGIYSYISSDGTLYVEGRGAYTTSSSNASWYSQRGSIKKIVVKEGITNIGSNAFANCSYVTEVTLNNTGTVDYYAFRDCSALTRVNVGSGVTEFKSDNYLDVVYMHPFSGCSKLATINVTDLKAFCAIKGLEYLTDKTYGTAAVKTLMVNGSTHSSTSELVIPEGMTEIPNVAFRYFSNVTKIKFPSTMETIYSKNFKYHDYLTEITVPSTVSSVGSEAFSYCDALKTVTLNNKGNIGKSAFQGCKALQTVTLNNKGTIGIQAFWFCSALTRVNIGSGVKGFDYDTSSSFYDTFSNCSNLSIVNVTDLKAYCTITGLAYLTDSSKGTASNKTLMINGSVHSSTSELVIPEGVTEIPNAAFRYFSNVTKIKFPSTMETISPSNFSGYFYLTEITVPSTVSSVGSDAFSYCISMKTATLNNKGSIGNSAFEGCEALQTVTLNNNGVIGKKAFWYCSALTRVNIGSGVTGFNHDTSSSFYDPFSNCSNLTTVNVTDLKTYCAIYGLEYLNRSSHGTAKDKTLMVNGVALSSSSELVIPEGVTSISSYAFYNFKNLTNVRIPSTVTSIGNYAFSSSTNLERIICLAPTCPLTGDYLATNADNITLKVPGGTASLYKSAKVWKEFNIVEGNLKSSYGTMLARQSRTFSIDSEVLAWSVSDESVATLNGNKVTAKNFVYDGTTELPYKSVVVTAILENCDRYVWNIKVYPREVSLTDGNAYKNTEDVDVPKISYTRTFADKVVNKWQCFYVPFDIEITDEILEDFDFAELYMVSYFDADENGEIEDGEPLRMTFCRLYAGKTLHANTPYYIRAKSSGTKTFEVTNTTLMAAANGSVDCSTTKHVYSLVGIYEPTYMQGRYGMALNGGFTYVTNPTTKLGAYRWYMEVKSRTGELENLARPIEIYVEGDEETTGIVALEDKASAPQSDKVFTLDGRQVNNTDNLPSGMYIINGKKVFKK